MTKTKEKKQRTTRPIKVIERTEYIDPVTKEKVPQYTFKIEERDANFYKLWLCHIAAALELIGNQKIRILSHILENTRPDNVFIGTQRAIAEATETSTKTVTETIKMLIFADVLKMQQAGVYLINPEVVFKGGTNNRMDILYKYYDTSKKR